MSTMKFAMSSDALAQLHRRGRNHDCKYLLVYE